MPNASATWITAALLGLATGLAGSYISGANAQALSDTGHECLTFGAPPVLKSEHFAGLNDNPPLANVPPGWSPIGGASANGSPFVVACRPVR